MFGKFVLGFGVFLGLLAATMAFASASSRPSSSVIKPSAVPVGQVRTVGTRPTTVSPGGIFSAQITDIRHVNFIPTRPATKPFSPAVRPVTRPR